MSTARAIYESDDTGTIHVAIPLGKPHRRAEVIVTWSAIDEADTAIATQDQPITPIRTRTLGTLRGRMTVPDDFDAPLPEDLLRAFEGEGSL